MTAMVHVELPSSLCLIARTERRFILPVPPPVTQRRILDAVEARFPMLRGTIRDHKTHLRRPFIRFFACQEDLSHRPPDETLPDAVADGREVFFVIAAIAGG